MAALIWQQWTNAELSAIRGENRWREHVAFDGNGVDGFVRGKQVVAFAANDYLGLSQHLSVRDAAHAAVDRFGTGATAARLVVGTRGLHHELEGAIASWKHSEAALLFPNGYAANLGVLTTFGGEDVTIFSDALNHASIIDGCRLSKSRVVVYRHCDMNHLGDLLHATAGRKIVVTDSVFSMDGDIAPLCDLAALCAQHDALLILDEAHAVLGPEFIDDRVEVLRMGTLSKTLGSLGGWIAGPRAMIDLLVNRARSFVFTTGLSPADTAAALAALVIYRDNEGKRLRERLRTNIDALRSNHPSPIVPWILGEDRAALDAAAYLFSNDIFIPAIRPPTVPPGTARLRIALSALHTDEMIRRLLAGLANVPCKTIGPKN